MEERRQTMRKERKGRNGEWEGRKERLDKQVERDTNREKHTKKY